MEKHLVASRKVYELSTDRIKRVILFISGSASGLEQLFFPLLNKTKKLINKKKGKDDDNKINKTRTTQTKEIGVMGLRRCLQ